MAFVDFEGCFALTCANTNCKCGFCAWCLTDCGSDAHAHVPKCRRLFGTLEEFNNHHNHRRREVIIERLRREPEKLRERVLVKLSNNLRELNMQPIDMVDL